MSDHSIPFPYRTRRAFVARSAPHYQTASLAQKSLLLDRFVDLTGYTRKSAIRLLTVEQEYATCQNQLTRLQFESLDLQQRLEEAERKVQSGSKKKIRATPAHHPLRESYHET